ncbi:MAG: PhoPQ-activated protein PqaA family protein [Planctomycetaceae bacterium]|nr:PhoPQ-activated protein PqaA family protein [Planctomycetaceae bacterium]
MKIRWMILGCYVLVVLAANTLSADNEVPKSLERYVKANDDSFSWEHLDERKTDFGTVYRLKLVSQTWHDIVWSHALTIYKPAQIAHPKHALLFVSGGSTGRMPSEKDQEVGLRLANACGACVAYLNQVPNQPLLGDRVEDDLITETWLRYLKTGDDTWPLLFPMVKSAVKAMDAVEEFSQQKLELPIEKFVITGASKRGWTSWLSPVVDKRIAATAPIVIDVLNFMKQTLNQKATWGKYSEQIIDYTSKGLVKTSLEAESERERQLRVMMDPFTYRSQLSLPKLMIVGTNDPYWVVDAMNIYWDDLVGPKYVLQVPNAGHGLDGGREHTLNTLSIYFQHVASATALPKISWNLDEGKLSRNLKINCDQPIVAAKLWSSKSSDLDFRDDTWTSTPLVVNGKSLTTLLEGTPDDQHIAYFVELTFKYRDRPYSLTTLVFKQ